MAWNVFPYWRSVWLQTFERICAEKLWSSSKDRIEKHTHRNCHPVADAEGGDIRLQSRFGEGLGDV